MNIFSSQNQCALRQNKTFCIPFGASRCIHKGNPLFSEQATDSCSMVNWSSCLVFTRAKQLERRVQKFASIHSPYHSRAKTTWHQACRKREHVARLSCTLWLSGPRSTLTLPFLLGPCKGWKVSRLHESQVDCMKKNYSLSNTFLQKI